MPSFRPLWALSAVACLATCEAAQDNNSSSIETDGLTSLVEWDHHSLMYNGQRFFELSGEFHPFRIPVPELWKDIMEKIRAMGMTSFSWYCHWGYHAANNFTLDFASGGHDVEQVYQYAKDVGLFVQSRPGPYINGELSAGGFPLWLTTGSYGSLRNADTAYTNAWMPYLTKVMEIAAPYQVTRNGTALLWQIENEFGPQWSSTSSKTPNSNSINYFKIIENTTRENDIEIPFISNDPSMSYESWSKDFDTVGAGGDVDLYGLDSYPLCWSCVPSDCSKANPAFTLLDYFDYFQGVSLSQPMSIPEFQGGMLNPWYGPNQGCLNLTDWEFVNLYMRDNVAQKISMLSFYMIFGGTNWGWLAVPFVPTSYDYNAAIAEDRSLRQKYFEMKLMGLSLQAAADLPGTWQNGKGTNYSDNSAIYTTDLWNENATSHFYVTRHATSTTGSIESFSLNVSTSLGNIMIPQKASSIQLNGHVSKIIPTDYHFGKCTLIYSTAEILSFAVLDGEPVLAMWVAAGEEGEFYLKGAKSATVSHKSKGSSVHTHTAKNGLVVNFTQEKGMSVVTFNNGVRVLIMDRITAYSFWAPSLSSNPISIPNELAFINGPYLVRSATLSAKTLVVRGDVNATTTLEVFTSSEVKSVTWNGQSVSVTKTAWGSLKGTIAAPASFEIPAFGPWKISDSLPEAAFKYDDTGIAWVDANHTTTPNPSKAATLPYLYVDDYGFHTGVHLFRGYFEGSTDISGAYLKLQGGNAFGFSVYLNGDLIGSNFGGAKSTTADLTVSFSNATIHKGKNVLFVIQDNSGHDEGSGALNARGILNATLLSSSPSNFSSWKIAGTAGGQFNTTLDPTRTLYNEGGLYGERLGWHLPGFNDSKWAKASPKKGFFGPTVKFFRSTLDLSGIPTGHDVSITFSLTPIAQSDGGNAPFRAFLYVNGYQYARFYPHIRETNPYPVPPGVLNYSGENTIALAVWAQTVEGAAVELTANTSYVVNSGLDTKFDGEYLRPGWTKERRQYK